MTTLGKIQEFCPEKEKFLERVELFFAANDIPTEKQVPVFLSVVGGVTYGVLRNLIAPHNPNDTTFEEITTTLKAHFEPKTLVIVERFHFHRRNQSPEESVNDYVAELRRLATNCAFGTYLEQALRDRLVCGLRNENIQIQLLTEADLTLTCAVQVAQGMEAAHKNALSFKGRDLPVRIKGRKATERLVLTYRQTRRRCCSGGSHVIVAVRWGMASTSVASNTPPFTSVANWGI